MLVRDSKARASVLGLACGLATGVALNGAQAQPATPPPTPAATVPDPAAPEVTIQPAAAPRFYGGIEYLHWWVKGAPLSVPLLSTGPDAEPIESGFLRSPQAIILYGSPFSPAVGGNNTQSFPGLSGSRLTLGYWLDDDRRYAIEGEGFGLQYGTATFQTHSDGTGSPGMRIPMYNSVPYRAGGVGEVVPPVVRPGREVGVNGLASISHRRFL